MYTIILSRLVMKKHVSLLRQVGLLRKVNEIIDLLRDNPYQTPPFYEKLNGKLDGKYSRRINIQHRLVYDVDEDKKQIHIVSMWSHYEDVENQKTK